MVSPLFGVKIKKTMGFGCLDECLLCRNGEEEKGEAEPEGIEENYVFEDDGELCYFGGSDNISFENFINSLLIKLFKYYTHMFFEIDSNDKVAIRMFNLFKKPKESYNTYILK